MNIEELAKKIADRLSESSKPTEPTGTGLKVELPEKVKVDVSEFLKHIDECPECKGKFDELVGKSIEPKLKELAPKSPETSETVEEKERKRIYG